MTTPNPNPCAFIAWRMAAAVCLAATAAVAQAQTWSTQTGAPDTSPKAAQARFEADKKLCAAETSPEARLQCRRDAQTVYDKALASAPPQGVYGTQAQAPCADCGRVTAVTVGEQPAEGGAVGMIAGGVAGALLGNQVGGGFGKDLATMAGAVGGALAGKHLEGKMGTRRVWTVTVQYPDGRTAPFVFEQDPGLSVGTSVKNAGQTVVRY